MARLMPVGLGAAVTLEVNGQRRTWRLDDLESFVLQPRDLRDLDDLPQPHELTEDFTASPNKLTTRTWYKSPPPPPKLPRTTQAELYHLVRAWMHSPFGNDDAGLDFLNEELRRHGEGSDLPGFLEAYEERREREAEEDRAFGLLDDDDEDDDEDD